MSLYLLRHCERYLSPEFYTELTTYGKNCSKSLIIPLENLKINEIYCSPFIRTLQTVAPYAKLTNILIKPENAIYECIREPFFKRTDFRYGINDAIKEFPEFKDIIQTDYVSECDLEDIVCSDDLKDVYDRIVPFIDNIKKRVETGNNILLVTHRTTFNIIRDYIEKGSFLNRDPTWTPNEGDIVKVI